MKESTQKPDYSKSRNGWKVGKVEAGSRGGHSLEILGHERNEVQLEQTSGKAGLIRISGEQR